MAISSRSCPNADELDQFLSGNRSHEDIESLAQHLETCERCATLVEKAILPDDALRALRQSSQRDADGGRNLSAGEGVPKAMDAADKQSVQQLIQRLQELQPQLNQETIDSRMSSAGAEATSEHSGEAGEVQEEIASLLSPPELPDELGRLGSYRVLKVLGAGGMGMVFQAEDLNLGRLVALKVMRPSVAKRPESRQRFLREARSAAAVKHDHIVAIHTVGEDRGVVYLAIEFLEGEPLDVRLQQPKPLSLGEILRIGRETALGLAAAHKRGLIHRDIKPANLWIEAETQRTKVLDFGLARGVAEDAQITQSGAIIGTPAFMAPEQARGDQVDARSDLFSLGVVLYRMCAGKLPFSGSNTMAVLMSLANDMPRPVDQINPETPKALSNLIAKLLEKEPTHRPQSAEEVVLAFDAMKKAEAAFAAPPRSSSGAPAQPSPKDSWQGPRRRLAGAASVLLIAGIVAAGVVLFWPTPNGTLRIEIDDDETSVQVDQKGIELLKKGKKDVRVEPGPHGLLIRRGSDFKFHTDQFILTRGQTVTIRIDFSKDRLRLQKNGNFWQETPLEGDTTPAAKSKTNAPPVRNDEPPPLAEWLKGREILTVSQDGKAQFKTIQAALRAIQAGQTVQVLDKGPYRENLTLHNLPKDTGLVSEVQTILESPEWRFGWKTKPPDEREAYFAHTFDGTDGFRLHGFEMRFAKAVGKWDEGKEISRLSFRRTRDLVLENCYLHALGDFNGETVDLSNWGSVDGLGMMITVRECVIEGTMELNTHNGAFPSNSKFRSKAIVSNNYFVGTGTDHQLGVQGDTLSRLVVRHNVFDGNSSYELLLKSCNTDSLEIINNTFASKNGVLFAGKIPAGEVAIRNNVRGGDGAFVGMVHGDLKQMTQAARSWKIDHNYYPDWSWPDSPLKVFPRASGDFTGLPRFISKVPREIDYLRIRADDAHARDGAGGVLPDYLGALSPGPAPKQGDWFSRVRGRWDGTAPTGSRKIP